MRSLYEGYGQQDKLLRGNLEAFSLPVLESVLDSYISR